MRIRWLDALFGLNDYSTWPSVPSSWGTCGSTDVEGDDIEVAELKSDPMMGFDGSIDPTGCGGIGEDFSDPGGW